MLHDIGKLGIPDAILLKPGPLTHDEWQVMRLHDEMGVAIVKATFASSELTNIIKTHHAWFAGNPANPGLPTGTDIPYSARLLAIADAFDAMVSDRPYRKGCTQDEAFSELRRCASTQFDPELVDRFIQSVTDKGIPTSVTSTPSASPFTLRLDQAVEKINSSVRRGRFCVCTDYCGSTKICGSQERVGKKSLN